MFEIIDDLKNKLDQHRPLSPAIVKIYKKILLYDGPIIRMQLKAIHLHC